MLLPVDHQCQPGAADADVKRLRFDEMGFIRSSWLQLMVCVVTAWCTYMSSEPTLIFVLRWFYFLSYEHLLMLNIKVYGVVFRAYVPFKL